MKRRTSPDGFWLVYSAWLLLILLYFLCSCSRTSYVPIEASRTDSTVYVHSDTVWRERIVTVRDSSVRTDSVLIKEYIREVVDSSGRIFRTDREREQTTVRETERYASLLSEYQQLEREYESLNRAYLEKQEVPVPVERKLTGWEQLKLNIGGKAIVVIVIVIFIAVAWLAKKLKKK